MQHLLPQTTEEFSDIINRIHNLIHKSLIREGKAKFLSPLSDIFLYVMKDFTNRYNAGPEAQVFLENMCSLSENINYHNTKNLLLMTSLREVNDFSFKHIPEFSVLVSNGYFPENLEKLSPYMHQYTLITLFLVQKLLLMDNNYTDESIDFTEHFLREIRETYNNEKGTDLKTDLENTNDLLEYLLSKPGINHDLKQPARRFTYFYENIIEKAIKFYQNWYITKIVNFDEMFLLSKLTSDPEVNTHVRVEGTVVATEMIRIVRGSDYCKSLKKETAYLYNLFIMTSTGKLFNTKLLIPKILPEKIKNFKRKSLILNKQNYTNAFLGGKLNISGTVQYANGYPHKYRANGKQFSFATAFLTHVKYAEKNF